MEKKNEEKLDSWGVEYGPIGDLVGYLEEEKSPYFFRIKLCHFKSLSSILWGCCLLRVLGLMVTKI